MELLSQAKAVLHLMLVVLVEGARAFENFLVLLVVVTFGMRFINGGDDVVWSAAAILTSFGPLRPIATTVPMVTAVLVAAITVASFVGALVAAMC